MAGMGRGSRLLQKLKEKEEEKKQGATQLSPTKVQAVEKPIVVNEPPKSPERSPPKSPPRVETKPLIKGTGRGILSSILSKQTPTKPNIVPIQSGATIIRQSETGRIPEAVFQRISPIQEMPRRSVTPEEPIAKTSPQSVIQPVSPLPAQQTQPAVPAPQETAAQPIRPLARGLGRGSGLASRLSSLSARPPVPASSAQAARPIQKEPQPAPAKLPAPAPVSVPTPPPIQREEPAPTVLAGSSHQGSDARTSEPARVSLTSSQDSRPLTQAYLTSIATASSKSVEKAMEELKVEHIMRKSPVRKLGDSGLKADFMTNYVKLKCNNLGVYQYVVRYDPPVDSQFHRIKLLGQLYDIIGSVRLFDGYTLFLPILLKEKTTKRVARRRDNTEVELTVQLTKILPPEQIPSPVFNIIFKNIMKELNMSRIGQHYFSSMKQIDVPNHNLQVWPGYTTAVHEFEDGLYLVIDVAHKVLRSQTCWHMMGDIYQRFVNDKSAFRQETFNALVGNVILTRYNNKTYRIDDIMWDQNPMNEFVFHNGERTTYFDYYKKHYDIEIKDLRQPLLINRAKPKAKQATAGNGTTSPADIICLIPELCFMTGLSNEIRTDINVKKDLATHTRLSPSQRVEQLRLLIQSIVETPAALKQITNWGLELDTNLAYLDGRVMPNEKIIFARREVETDFKCDWTKACGNEPCLQAVDLKHWICVYPGRQESLVERFVTLAREAGRRVGVNIDFPDIAPLRDDKPDTFYNEIKKKLTNLTQMVVIFFPMVSDSRYMRVKRLCCIECPVPSQVVVIKTINKPENVLRTVAQKIVLQMNVKLGGELWRLNIPIKKMMIVGIDIYHKTEKKYKSIAGFVSSLNHDQTRWYSKVCFQMVGQELTDTLKIAFMQSLKKYQEVNGFLPEKIIIYRDGVSEGQISVVSDHEVAQLRSCFAQDYSPKMCVIVVQKRINTRIFSNMNNNQVNPKPGAIIDHGITSKELFDFFLVSQHVGQGTVTPTHYIVAFEDTQMKPDHIQRLSYKMTHMYYNWSGTIRVPAPCQYAHKLAFLTGQYLQDEPSEELCNRLFYL